MRKLLFLVLGLVSLYQLTQGQILPKADAKTKDQLKIFVSFKDQLTTPWSRSLSGWQELLNSDDPWSFSARSFFTQTSYGQFNFKMNFVQESNPLDTVPDYQDPYPEAYYHPIFNNVNPIYPKDQDELDRRTDSMLVRMITYVNSMIPYSFNLDKDNNGTLDHLVVTCRRLGTHSKFIFMNWNGGFPWRGKTGLSMPKIKNLNYGGFSSISGVDYHNPHFGEMYVHELGHSFGLPDVYINGNPSFYRNLRGTIYQDWYFKRSYTSYYLWQTIGWIPKDKAPLITKSGTYSLHSLYSESPDSVTCRIKSPNSQTEFFMLEFRTRHPHEWWHNSEGLLISLINPVHHGNARGSDNYGPFEAYIVRPKTGSHNALLLNQSVSANTDPALRLSNGMPAGFSINNIRKIGDKVYFDVEFDDEPFITAYEKPDIVNGNSAGQISWDITVNPSNKNSWTATSNSSWLTVQPDYQNSKLILNYTRNYVYSQRNAVITLSATGATDKKAYLVQRGSSNSLALWLPELVNDTLVIKGHEDSYSVRVIGDISPYSHDWMVDFAGDGKFQKGKINDLDNPFRSFYARTNKTNTPIVKEVKYKDKVYNTKVFVIKQLPVVGDTAVYKGLTQSLPVVNDGKWYFVRTERAREYLGSFLGAKRHSSGNLLAGNMVLSQYSDTLLWTVESAGANVVLRNKALGYLDMNLYNGMYRFTNTKPATGYKMIENWGQSGYSVLGAAFQGTTTSVKGIHMSVSDFIVGDWFGLWDNSTLFFEENNLDYIIQYGNNHLFGLEAGTRIGNTTVQAYERLFNAVTNATKTGSKLPADEQLPYVREILAAINQMKQEIVLPVSSTVANPVWYRIRRIDNNFWTRLANDMEQYLKVESISLPVQKANLIPESDNFLFRFESSVNGTVRIVPKLFSGYYVSTANTPVKLSNFNDNTTNLKFMPVMSRYGVHFLIRGSEQTNGFEFIRYDGGNADILRSVGIGGLGVYSDNLNRNGYLFNFEYMSGLTGVEETTFVDKIKYKVLNRVIILENPDYDKHMLFDIRGIRHDFSSTLTPGAYIIKRSDGRSEKVIVN